MAARQNFIVQVANVSKDAPLDVEKWICMYPAYIDQERTLKEGRRLSKENCTKNPDAYAIYYVCAVLLKLQVALECKRYSVRGGTMLDVEWAVSKSTCRTRKGKRN